MYTLSNWTIVQRSGHAGDAAMRLRGEVSCHERYQAGSKVTISALRSCSRKGGKVLVMTHSGTEYVLGPPDPIEPAAMARLLAYMRAKSEATTMGPSEK
jgi:hypothetical protein